MRGISSMAKAVTPASAIAFERGLVAVGVHDGDDQRALVDPGKLGRIGPPHLEHHVGAADSASADTVAPAAA